MKCIANIPRFRLVGLAVLIAGLLLVVGGCRTNHRPAGPTTDSQAGAQQPIDAQLAAGYALLHGVAEKNKDVSKILIIKSAPETFESLIRTIARESESVATAIEQFAEQLPGLNLRAEPLPKVESETRGLIEGTTSRQLLGSSGREFQVRLAAAQIDATKYIAHLARAVADRENHEGRASYLQGVGDRFDELNKRLFESLQGSGASRE